MSAHRHRIAAGLALLLAAPLLVAFAADARAQNANTANYMEQGGKSWVVGSGGTLAVKAGGSLTSDDCAGAGQGLTFGLTSATAQTAFVYVANRPMKVAAVRARIATAAGSTLTATLNKVASGAASSTAAAVHSGSLNLNAASDTPQSLTMGTGAGVQLAVGDALYWSMSGTIAATLGVVSVCLAPQ